MSRADRLWIVLGLNMALVAGLLVVGLSAHSLGVLAEGADYLGDGAAIGVSLLAIWLSEQPASPRRPNRSPRATAIAAGVNSGWLLVLSVLVAIGAIDRLIVGVHQVHGLPVLVVSGIAAAVMGAGALILRGDTDDADPEGGDLNLRAVLLDTAADAASAGSVAVVGAIMLATGGLYWLDPTIALLVSGIVIYHSARLLRQVTAALSRSNAKLSPTVTRSGLGTGRVT